MQADKEYAKQWLLRRGITHEVIRMFGIRWGEHPQLGGCIFIPVFREDGAVAFNKYRRNPLDETKPKYIYDKGGKTTLYGWHLAKKEKRILITEGEMDALVAWSANIPAVSSTGGAMSFQDEWAELLKDKEVVICYDNDDAGAKGAVRTLSKIPHAKVLLIPEEVGIKDLSDYSARNGNIHDLLRTARHYLSIEEIKEEKARRASVWQSTRFHDAYIDAHKVAVVSPSSSKTGPNSKLERAKAVPIINFLAFTNKKALCIWHSERTPSLHYYSDKNKVYCWGCGAHGDVIDVVRQIRGCSFKEAVDILAP